MAKYNGAESLTEGVTAVGILYMVHAKSSDENEILQHFEENLMEEDDDDWRSLGLAKQHAYGQLHAWDELQGCSVMSGGGHRHVLASW